MTEFPRPRQGEKYADFKARERAFNIARDAERKRALNAARQRLRRAAAKAEAMAKADIVDGYNRDDIGLSPDF